MYTSENDSQCYIKAVTMMTRFSVVVVCCCIYWHVSTSNLFFTDVIIHGDDDTGHDNDTDSVDDIMVEP